MNNLTMSAEEQPDTYPQPEDGWVCFHCGERFKKVGAAEDHFGARPGDGLACRIKAGDERGLVMDLRKAQKRTHELQDKVDRGGCTLAGPKRGDCSHFIGLPGHAIPGRHDGLDDTVDCHGKPNGWCWACWRVEQIRQAEQAAIDETRNEIKAGLPSARETLAHIQNILAIGDNPDVEALIRDCLADFRLGVAQAARADERRKTLEEAAQIAEPNWRIANEIRALTNESGEPGEAA